MAAADSDSSRIVDGRALLVISATAGDTSNGNGGNDRIVTSDGSDVANGGAGCDMIVAGRGGQRLSGGGDDLKLPLGLADGAIRIGPFAIADAPRLAPPR